MDAAGLDVRVCTGLCCGMAGADELARELPALLGGMANVAAVACVGRCDEAPSVLVGDIAVPRASCEAVMNALVAQQLVPAAARGRAEPLGDYLDCEGYRAEGGYSLLAAIATSDAIAAGALEALQVSGVGSWTGVPLAQQLRQLRETREGREPDHAGESCEVAVRIEGASTANFRDRQWLERDPHRLLEGLLVAAQLAGAATVKVCLPPDLDLCGEMLEGELLELAGNPPCELPAIAIECGDAPADAFDCEALLWVRDILEKGPAWYLGFGRNGALGLRAVAVAGGVAEPGVKIAPAGIALRELIDEFCGGIADGGRFHAATVDVRRGMVVVLGEGDETRAGGMGAIAYDAGLPLK